MWFLSLQTVSYNAGICLEGFIVAMMGGEGGGAHLKDLKELHQVGNHSSVDDLHVVEQEESCG